MALSLPHFEKFIPPWLCAGGSLLIVVTLVAILFVFATRRRDEELRP
jgi:hypothetical protein